MKYFLLLILPLVLNSPQRNVEEYFGTRYDEALSFYKKNYNKISKIIESEGVNEEIVLAIGFPELIRYSMWRDLLETSANEMFYIKKGNPYTYFSIGRFQIKPSFIEKLEDYLIQDDSLSHQYKHIYTYKSTNTKDIRATRIERLKSYQWQIRYISAFCKIVEKRFDLQDKTLEEKIAFYSAAYNNDFLNDSSEIAKWTSIKYFPYGTKSKNNPFSYAEVANYFSKHGYPQVKKRFFWN